MTTYQEQPTENSKVARKLKIKLAKAALSLDACSAECQLPGLNDPLIAAR